MRTDIKDRIQEAKLGAGLIHLPSGYVETNTVWMWAALLAGNLSTLLQAITGIDTGKQGRAHGDRLRQQLLRVPARVPRHARGLTLRLPPGQTLPPEVMADLHALPAPSGQRSRHRLNRGGDRALNRALHTVAITRLRCHPESIAYQIKRTAQGKTHRDIRRSVKRALARRLYRRIEAAIRLENATIAA